MHAAQKPKSKLKFVTLDKQFKRWTDRDKGFLEVREPEANEQQQSIIGALRLGEQLLRSGNLSRSTLVWVARICCWKQLQHQARKAWCTRRKKKQTFHRSCDTGIRYAKRTIRWFCPSCSRCKDWRGQPQRDRERTIGTICTCEEMYRGAANGTHSQSVKAGAVEQ